MRTTDGGSRNLALFECQSPASRGKPGLLFHAGLLLCAGAGTVWAPRPSAGAAGCMAWMLDTAHQGAGPSAQLLSLLAHLAALKAARLQGPLRDSVTRVSGRIEQATLQALGAGGRAALSACSCPDLRGCALFKRIAVLHTSLWGHLNSALSISDCKCWRQSG